MPEIPERHNPGYPQDPNEGYHDYEGIVHMGSIHHSWLYDKSRRIKKKGPLGFSLPSQPAERKKASPRPRSNANVSNVNKRSARRRKPS